MYHRALIACLISVAPAVSAKTVALEYEGTADLHRVRTTGPLGKETTRIDRRQLEIRGRFTIDVTALPTPAVAPGSIRYEKTKPEQSPFLSSAFVAPEGLEGLAPLPASFGDVSSLAITDFGFESSFILKDALPVINSEELLFNGLRRVTRVEYFNSLSGSAGTIPTMIVDGKVLPDFAKIGEIRFTSYFQNARRDFDADGILAFTNVATDTAIGSVRVLRVTILGVPEPSTWALMVFGFGSLGVVARSRARRLAV